MQQTKWPASKIVKQPSRAKRWWIVGAAVACVIAGGAAWWRYTHPPEDPQVTKVKELQRQVFASMEAQRPAATGAPVAQAPATSTPATAPAVLTPKEREVAMTQLRTEMDKLTDEQREQVMRGFGNAFRERMRTMVKEYRALPKEKRTAFLDKQIDEMEERRAQFQRGGGFGGPGGGGPPGAPPGGGGPGGNNSASAGASGGAGGPRREGDRGGPPSEERRSQWRRNMLAETSPQERAEAELYFSDLNDRRKARGLEAFGPGARR